ncbi:MAG: DUF2029 domain-containing protein [Clostridiales bacterium]|nr:DUF2029 domain-containing protein [Clostridiales bacterium]
MNRLKEKRHSLRYLTVNKLYFGLAFLLVGVSVIVIAVTGGEAFENLYWHGDTVGIYPDLFESVIQARTGNPYELDAIYPAFAYCLIYFFNFFIPGDYDDNFGSLSSICSNTETLVIAHLFYAFITLAIAYFIVKTFGDDKCKGKYLLVLVFITSSPFIFLIERGNTVIITIVFLFIYILYYNSENKKLREIALICLACAAAMKLYPAVFGLLLLSDKKFKEAIRAIIYGIVLFVVPFFFMGGLDEIPTMLSNILTLNSNTITGSTGFGYGFKVNATSSIGCVLEWLTGKSSTIYIKIGVYFFVGLLLASSFFLKSRWKKVAALSLIVILMPDFSFIYNVIYLLVPLALFIKENGRKRLTFVNYLYTLLFVGAFAPLPFGDIFRSIGGYNSMNWVTLVSSLCLIALAILLAIEGIYRCVAEKHKVLIAVTVAGSLVISAVPLVLNDNSKADILTEKSVWTLTDNESEELNEIYDFVISDTVKDGNVLCFPYVDTLSVFDDYSNTYWYSELEAGNTVTVSRLFKSLSPQFVVLDLSNYANFKIMLKNEECSESEYDNLMSMQTDIIEYLNKYDYSVVDYIKTENDRIIAVWEKTEYAEEPDFWNDGGNGTKDDPYILSTTEQLALFSDITNCGRSFSKEYVALGCDIDASEIEDFKPIAKYGTVGCFGGVFDGQGHTISNLTIAYEKETTSTGYCNASFVNNLNGMIVNLCIEDSYFSGYCCSVFARVSNTTSAIVVNCISRNNTLEAGARAGAFADQYGATLLNCIAINNDLTAEKSYGFVSIKNSGATVVHCYSTATDEFNTSTVISADVINTKTFASVLNGSIDTYEDTQLKYNKKRKKSSNKIIIPNYKHWTVKDGVLSFA